MNGFVIEQNIHLDSGILDVIVLMAPKMLMFL